MIIAQRSTPKVNVSARNAHFSIFKQLMIEKWVLGTEKFAVGVYE